MSKPKHHVRQEVCLTRAPYRDGRKPTAVKVYTIHHESKYLLVQGVSATGVSNDLVKLFETVGDIEEHKILDDYPSEQFTEVHLIKYKRIQSARFAKRRFDDWSFFGSILHVCYAPEFETVQETREKLRDRRRIVEAKTKQYRSDGTYSNCIIQTSTSSAVNEAEDVKKTGSPHQALSLENGDVNLPAGTHQYNTSAGHSEQTQNLISNNQNFQQYGVQDLPSFSSAINHTYGEISAPSLNLQNSQNLQASIEHSFKGYSGIKELPYTNVQYQQKSQSYGEHVVQQARSLQNYGKIAILNRGNELKRPNTEISETDESGAINKLHNDDLETEEQLILPPPPKQMRYLDKRVQKSQTYGGAKVPSAQATFPADFDARKSKGNIRIPKVEDSDSLETNLDNKTEKNNSKEELSKAYDKTVKTMQEKVEESLKNKNIVIKEFKKKTTVPMFIPRQAQIRNKTGKVTDKAESEKDVRKINELNKEIRKNALMLGKVQGPADLGPSQSKESLDPKEKSVLNSTLEIRKKLKEIKD